MTLDIRKTRCDQCLFSKERIVDVATTRVQRLWRLSSDVARIDQLVTLRGRARRLHARLRRQRACGASERRCDLSTSDDRSLVCAEVHLSRPKGNSGVNVVGLFARWRF